MADDYGAQRWMELAACINDARFTAERPSDETLIEMTKVCASCEVFAECLRYHDFPDVIGVFAAGVWRSECTGS